jgi:uncharacterized protein (TIGR02757 family)
MPTARRSHGRRGHSDAALLRALDDVIARCDQRSRLALDPVGVVRRFDDPSDRELVALVASSIAFGNVRTIRAKLEQILVVLGPRPTSTADDRRALRSGLSTWRHRLYLGEDIASLLEGARSVQRTHGSLGRKFERDFARTADIRESLALLVDAIRREGGLSNAHLLPDVRAGSGVKRLVLFLKWMARPDDGVDLGLWDVPTSALVMPVDTHILRLSRNLGLTARKDASWKTALEISAALRRLDPTDPTRFDFALCHLGMVQGCPSRRDPVRCQGCGVKPVCRHW